MDFKQSLEKLGILEYAPRIFNSNSNGELFHLDQYFVLAEIYGDAPWFKEWFVDVVTYAEKNWKRPESVFQHIVTIMEQQMAEARKSHPLIGGK